MMITWSPVQKLLCVLDVFHLIMRDRDRETEVQRFDDFPRSHREVNKQVTLESKLSPSNFTFWDNSEAASSMSLYLQLLWKGCFTHHI